MIQFQSYSHCSVPIVIPPCNQLQGCGSVPSQLSLPVQSCQVPTGLWSVFYLTRLHTSPTLHHCTLTFGRYPDLTLEKEGRLFYLSVSLVHVVPLQKQIPFLEWPQWISGDPVGEGGIRAKVCMDPKGQEVNPECLRAGGKLGRLRGKWASPSIRSSRESPHLWGTLCSA